MTFMFEQIILDSDGPVSAEQQPSKPRSNAERLKGLNLDQNRKQRQQLAVPYTTANLPKSHGAFTASERANADPAHRMLSEIGASLPLQANLLSREREMRDRSIPKQKFRYGKCFP